MKVRYLTPIFRYFLGLLFLSTGIGKLLDNRGFADVIASYKLGLPHGFLLPIGLAFSLVELWVGINLLRGRALPTNALLTLIFHLGYASLAAMTLYREISLTNCGCFGVFWARPLTRMTVVEDLLLAGISLSYYLLLLKSAKSKR